MRGNDQETIRFPFYRDLPKMITGHIEQHRTRLPKGAGRPASAEFQEPSCSCQSCGYRTAERR